MQALYLEDINIGDVKIYSPITLTQELRDAHVGLYGEDWANSKDNIDSKKIIPAPLIISSVAGLMAKENFLHMKIMKKFTLECFYPFFIGDILTVKNIIVEKKTHPNIEKDYGYLTLVQEMYNQDKRLCYKRTVTLLVLKSNK